MASGGGPLEQLRPPGEGPLFTRQVPLDSPDLANRSILGGARLMDGGPQRLPSCMPKRHGSPNKALWL
eukprot:8873589-Alexandrium_andersonii.AAC.1